MLCEEPRNRVRLAAVKHQRRHRMSGKLFDSLETRCPHKSSHLKSSPPPSLDSSRRRPRSTLKLPNSVPCYPVAPLRPPPRRKFPHASERNSPLPHGSE